VPYRIDLPNAGGDALDRLVDLGALDAGMLEGGTLAVLMPDSVAPEQISRALGVQNISISPAHGRDEDSVWILEPRPIRIGGQDLTLIDAPAFGTGLHPTTALCLEALEEIVRSGRPDAVLDVGTGSGVLALAALMLGVPRAVGVDTDDDALRAAAENARTNGLADRLELVRGGPEAVAGTWPLVAANVLAAPLVDMAPTLVRRLGHHGQLVLSGIAESVESDVDDAYRRLGLRRVTATARAGWVALVFHAPW
jgi:ribosomal protein L11 methyltransferase